MRRDARQPLLRPLNTEPFALAQRAAPSRPAHCDSLCLFIRSSAPQGAAYSLHPPHGSVCLWQSVSLWASARRSEANKCHPPLVFTMCLKSHHAFSIFFISLQSAKWWLLPLTRASSVKSYCSIVYFPSLVLLQLPELQVRTSF